MVGGYWQPELKEVQLRDWCGNSGNERVKARNVIMAVEMGRKAGSKTD